MTRAWPVMKEASSEQRKTAPLAMSSRRAQAADGVLVLEVGVPGGILLPHGLKALRHHVAGQNRVDTNPVGTIFTGHLPGHSDDRGLGRLVHQKTGSHQQSVD